MTDDRADTAAAIADKLFGDWTPRAPYQTLAGPLAPSDLAAAYQAQALLVARFAETRGAVAGRKIALASKAMQDMVGIDQPVAGVIFSDEIRTSPARITLSAFRHVGLEYELAFRLKDDVGPNSDTSSASLPALVDTVHPAFELIEDKNADYSAIDVKTLVADNAWCGGVVLGESIADWRDLDLDTLPAVLRQKGMPDEVGTTGAASPWQSFGWVLEHFTGQGETLAAGEIIITGSVLRTRFPAVGDQLSYTVGTAAAVELNIV